MASYYVWSGAAGGGTGADWANAYTTLTTAISGKANGDIFYVAHDHLEASATSITLSPPNNNSTPGRVVCVNRGGSVPPVSADRRATAQVTTTGNTNISLAGNAHWDGFIFIAGNSTGVASINVGSGTAQRLRFDNCSFRLGSTGAGEIAITSATGSNYIEWNNTTASFSNVVQKIDIGVTLKWRNTPLALIGSAVPTTLFTLTTSRGGEVECIGIDLSAAGSGKTIFGTNINSNGIKCRLIDCKLDAAVTRSVVPAAQGANEVDIVRSAATGNYTVFAHRMAGTLEQETTIVRTGGASDGTTTISWKVTTTTNCTYSQPFECPPIAIWNDTTGSPVVATVECIAAVIATDAEAWLDVEYLGSGSSPLGSFVNDGRADLVATAANQTTSSQTWGGSTAAFKLAVTFTPQQKGWIYCRAMIGKASSTIYIDPLVVLS